MVCKDHVTIWSELLFLKQIRDKKNAEHKALTPENEVLARSVQNVTENNPKETESPPQAVRSNFGKMKRQRFSF